MLKLLKLHKSELLILLGLFLLYFILRLPNLTLQPIFADEAIYIRWAEVMRAEPTLRFLPLSDGKTPLFMWALMPLLKIFNDPLFAGRLLSVISGFATFLGVYLLSRKFFGVQTGLWAALLVVITPFMVFFDRMALVDSMLAAFSVWALFLSLTLIKYPRLDLAMFLGYMLGGGLLTKTPGFFNVLALPASLAIFNWKNEGRQQRMLKLFGLWLIAASIAFIMYNLLRLGPGFLSLSTRNQDYIFSPLDLVGRPLDPFIPHLNDLADWFPKLLTIPVMGAVVLGIIFTFVQRNRYAVAVLLWGLLPLLVELALLRTFTARYILFSIPPLLCIAGWGIACLVTKIKVKKVILLPVLLAVFSPVALYFNFLILTNPAKAVLPIGERAGYLEAWTAGYGFPEIAQYLILESKKGMVVVGTEGSFGTLPDGLQIYLDKHSHSSGNQVVVIGGTATVSAQIWESAQGHPTFFVANKSRFSKFTKGLELIKEYPKAQDNKGQEDAILFFRVLPEKGIF